MNDIFTNSIAMDCFCYDIVEAWTKYRKSKNMPYDEDNYVDWLDDFMRSMEMAYEEFMEDEDG